jgi:hypothetical protein
MVESNNDLRAGSVPGGWSLTKEANGNWQMAISQIRGKKNQHSAVSQISESVDRVIGKPNPLNPTPIEARSLEPTPIWDDLG